MLGWGSIPRRVWRVGTPPFEMDTVFDGVVGMSGGHCTHPTRGPAIRLKHKKPRIVDSFLLVVSFFYYMIK